MKKCTNPTCGYVEETPGIDVCRNCGTPLVEVWEDPSDERRQIRAIRIVAAILAIAVGIAAFYFFYGETGGEIPFLEWTKKLPFFSEKTTEGQDESMDPVEKHTAKPPREDIIKIGVVYGSAHGDDDEQKYLNAARMRADEINKAGGIGGKWLEIDGVSESIYHSDYDNIADYYASHEDIVAVVGYVNHFVLRRDIETYESRGVPLISPVGLNSGFGRYRRWTFIAEAPEADEGRFCAKYMKYCLAARKAAVLFGPGPYFERVEKEFITTAEEIDLAVVGEIPFPSNPADFRGQLKRIKEISPDCTLIIGCYDEANRILPQAREVGLATRFIGDIGCDSLSDAVRHDKAVDGLMTMSHVSFNESYKSYNAFEEAFIVRYSSEGDALTFRFYNLVSLVAKAIEVVGAERSAVRDYLASLESFEGGYHGGLGTFVFDEHGDLIAPMQVLEIRNGEYVPAERQLFPELSEIDNQMEGR